MNVKRVHRLYVEERLIVRRKRRKRLVRDRSAEPRLTSPRSLRALLVQIFAAFSPCRSVSLLSKHGQSSFPYSSIRQRTRSQRRRNSSSVLAFRSVIHRGGA